MNIETGKSYLLFKSALLMITACFLLSCTQQPKEKKEYPVYQEPSQLRITAPSGLVIRSGPGQQHSKLGSIALNETAEIIDNDTGPSETIDNKSSKWIKIKFHQTEGWIFGGYTETVSGQNTMMSGKSATEFILKGSCIPIEKQYTYKEIKAIIPDGFKESPSNSQLLIMNNEFTIILDKHNYDYILSAIEFKGKKELLYGIERGMTEEMVIALIGPPAQNDDNVDYYSFSQNGLSIKCAYLYNRNKLDKIIWTLM